MTESLEYHQMVLPPSAQEKMGDQADNYSAKNEYIEKAVRFYSGYLDTESTDEYLPQILSNVLEGKLSAFGNQIGHLLFKLPVDQNLMGNILAAGMEINPD